MTIEPSTLSLILGVLLGISELLGMIPAVRSNSIVQLIVNTLKRVKSAVGK